MADNTQQAIDGDPALDPRFQTRGLFSKLGNVFKYGSVKEQTDLANQYNSGKAMLAIQQQAQQAAIQKQLDAAAIAKWQSAYSDKALPMTPDGKVNRAVINGVISSDGGYDDTHAVNQQTRGQVAGLTTAHRIDMEYRAAALPPDGPKAPALSTPVPGTPQTLTVAPAGSDTPAGKSFTDQLGAGLRGASASLAAMPIPQAARLQQNQLTVPDDNTNATQPSDVLTKIKAKAAAGDIDALKYLQSINQNL